MTDIDAIRPATDLLLANLRETVGQVREHDHPASGGDLFCLNLTSYMGDRMGPVLRRLADEQAETRKWQERNTALADEFAAEAERLLAELAEANAEVRSVTNQLTHTVNDLAEARRQAHRDATNHQQIVRANTELAGERDALAEKVDAVRAVVEAAKAWARTCDYGDINPRPHEDALYDAVRALAGADW